MSFKSVLEALGQAPVLPRPSGRIAAIDLARGFAISLMIVSHAVSGLMPIREVPDWGMVPIHLVTKVSSSLFLIVFGVALAVAHLPGANDPSWPRHRARLMLRGLEILFVYKALTVVEMLPFFPPDDILEALLHRRSAIWVEILGFYAIALLWLPWVLPLWLRLPLWSRVLAPVIVALLAGWLERNAGFFGSETLKAILVEHEGRYTWGQLSRLPLVMLGLLIGEALLRGHFRPGARSRVVLGIGGGGAALLGAFLIVSLPGGIPEGLTAVAWNVGKHPPNLPFMLFSLGGALLILSLCVAASDAAARRLGLITSIGADPMGAFVFHIVVIFVIFRYLLDDLIVHSYPGVLFVGLGLVPATAAWLALIRAIRTHKRSPARTGH